MTPFDAPGNKHFENTVGKGEIARNEQFLLFPQFAGDNFKFEENHRKLSKRVENTVGKGEIAR